MTAQAARKETGNAYDEVPYQSFSYPHTHPASLHTIGTLFGLSPPDFRTARVLEIGCAAGGNLFPQALLHPKSSFVGFDFSAQQIEMANAQKAALGVENVEFRHLDILDFDLKKEKGKYDYIICHGILSWVPANVRAAIFNICREALSPKGLAIISYNCLPGWNTVRSLRDMMMYHTARFATPAEKIAQSRALIDFLIESTPDANHRAFLENERNLLKSANDTYLFHDHLEGENTQFYLHEFVKTANENGLDYVGDTEVVAMFIGNMPAKAVEALKAVNDIVAQEQYMDFITNRRFRSSILCRKGDAIRRNLRGEQILDYYLTPRLTPGGAVEGRPGTFSYKTKGGSTLTASDPVTVALLDYLAQLGPKPVAAADIISAVAKKHNFEEEAVRKNLVGNGIQLMLRGYIGLHSETIPSVEKPGKKPAVWPIARLQAGQPGCKFVLNLLSHRIETNEVANVVVSHLDGTRTAKDIVDVLVQHINDGRLKATKKDQPVTDGNTIRDDLAKSVDDLFARLAAQHLLVA